MVSIHVLCPSIPIDERHVGIGCRDNWAKNTSPNKDVKVYIGAPASSSAASTGYVSSSTLATIISQTMSQYSSFGGVMLWDASQAYGELPLILLFLDGRAR